MLKEAILKDPITVRLGLKNEVVIADEKSIDTYPLKPGVMFGGNHFGFIVIYDSSKGQKEFVIPTQEKIIGVALSDNKLNIYEEHKLVGWSISPKTGKIIHSCNDEYERFYHGYEDDIIKNEDVFDGKAHSINPIKIQLDSNDVHNSFILADEDYKKNIPLETGSMIGGQHFGFILKIGNSEICYETQNKIEAIGMSNSQSGEFEIYEDGKYHPWKFSLDGSLIEYSRYNPSSRKDRSYVIEHYGLEGLKNEDIFPVSKGR